MSFTSNDGMTRMGSTIQAAEITPKAIAESGKGFHEPTSAPVRRGGLGHVAANIGVALLFFGALLPVFRSLVVPSAHFDYSVANLIWIAGATLMGVLSLVRVPPNSAMINVRSVMATTGMMVAPVLMRQGAHSVGILKSCAVALEFFGVVLSQVSRIYLGRSFGLLPANRGIVSTGPFRIVRHPIYVGWFVLSVGYLMAYPALVNGLMIIVTLPFMMWRITLEEELLTQDPAYREYCQKTPYRLIPRVF
jgi:protein-S-isoprenylcysteine O-methyltransferase Ste14